MVVPFGEVGAERTVPVSRPPCAGVSCVSWPAARFRRSRPSMPASSVRPRRLRNVALVVTVVVLSAGAMPVSAQTEAIEQAKAEREAKAAEVAEAAASLDPLLAEDAELEAAVAALDLHVQAQAAKLDATEQTLAAAEEFANSADEDVAAMAASIEAIRAALRAAVVEAYVSPEAERVDSVLTTADITVAALKRAMLETVSGNQADLLDQLRASEARLVDLTATAAEAVAAVEADAAAAAAQLEKYQAALDDQIRVRAALQARIDEVHAEIAALESQEDSLTSLISGLIAEEDRKAALAEAKRRRAEEARLAAAQQAAAPGATPPPTLEPLGAPPSAAGLVWPAQGVLSSPFGSRWGRQHEGIDVAAPTGTMVVAAQFGVVLSAGTLAGYGNLVTIDHGDGLVTVYAHLSRIDVSAGQSVARGEQIGLMGCTGSCTGPHVHFETRILGVPQDPMLYL